MTILNIIEIVKSVKQDLQRWLIFLIVEELFNFIAMKQEIQISIP